MISVGLHGSGGLPEREVHEKERSGFEGGCRQGKMFSIYLEESKCFMIELVK